ncbi:hypothetical protein L9F63_013081, partial [Diploptera punctata]
MYTPYTPQNSMNRVTQQEYKNSLNIVVNNLQESDGGDYKCQAVGDDEHQIELHDSVYVNVKTTLGCPNIFFQCSVGVCVMRRYVCDGYKDCKGGEDESLAECGHDPCKNKLYCEDKRCIPTEWCCDPFQTPNCSVRVIPQCCEQLTKPLFVDHDSYMNDHHPQGLSDMGFLQTTIYTVVGCAMAFMFIVTILAIAICRVHMKRSSLLTRCPGARGGGLMMNPHAAGNRAPHHHHGLQHVPLYDLDVLLNRPPYPPSSVPSHSGLLVTYNINNGVQFVGRPIDPPPYCEIVASPPREGPPPPYASHESLSRTTPEASSTAQDEVDGDDPGERDSLLGPVRGTEQSRPVGVRCEYMDSHSPYILTTPNNNYPVERLERNHQIGSAVSVVLNNEVYDRNPVSSSDTICSIDTDDRIGELIVESGLTVNSCENLVVAPKLPDTQNKINHGEGSFSMVPVMRVSVTIKLYLTQCVDIYIISELNFIVFIRKDSILQFQSFDSFIFNEAVKASKLHIHRHGSLKVDSKWQNIERLHNSLCCFCIHANARPSRSPCSNCALIFVYRNSHLITFVNNQTTSKETNLSTFKIINYFKFIIQPFRNF